MKKPDIKAQNTRHDCQGFTLIELLVAIVISMIVITAVYTVFTNMQYSYIRHTTSLDAQQNVKATLDYMAAELREAGSLGFDFANLTQSTLNTTGIQNAQAAELRFTQDLDFDGNITALNEDVTYRLDADVNTDGIADNGSTSLQRIARYQDAPTALNPKVFMENVQAICFAYAYARDDGTIDYIDADNSGSFTQGDSIIWAYATADSGPLNRTISGGALPGIPLDRIRLVRIWILARTSRTIKNYANTNTYTVGDKTISGNGDNYMRYLKMTTVQLKNISED